MSTREVAIDLINQMPEYQVEKVIYIMRGMQIADDPFYSAENTSLLEKSANEIETGQVVKTDLAYIKELANG